MRYFDEIERWIYCHFHLHTLVAKELSVTSVCLPFLILFFSILFWHTDFWLHKKNRRFGKSNLFWYNLKGKLNSHSLSKFFAYKVHFSDNFFFSLMRFLSILLASIKCGSRMKHEYEMWWLPTECSMSVLVSTTHWVVLICSLAHQACNPNTRKCVTQWSDRWFECDCFARNSNEQVDTTH